MSKNKLIIQIGGAILITSLCLTGYAATPNCPKLKDTNFSAHQVDFNKECTSYSGRTSRGGAKRVGTCTAWSITQTHSYQNFGGSYEFVAEEKNTCKWKMHVGGATFYVRTDKNIPSIAPKIVQLTQGSVKCVFIPAPNYFIWVAGDFHKCSQLNLEHPITRDQAYVFDCTGGNCNPGGVDSASYYEKHNE